MKKNTEFSLNIGLPSILLIFVVLCLVSFGVLSLVSANSDNKLSQKVLQRSDHYYAICNEAEELLADINSQLLDAYISCQSKDGYFDAIKDTPTDYSYALSDLQELKISLTYLYPESVAEGFIRIDTWQIASSEDINYDEQLHVIP